MKNNPLLVPIGLDVLLLGDPQVEYRLADYAPKYEELGKNSLFGDKIVNQGTVFRAGLPGAHLHWVMPDALLQGKQDKAGKLKFPKLPNRWIVMRLSAGRHKIYRKAWIIQSDKISFDDEKPVTVNGMRKSAVPCVAFNETLGIWEPAGKNGAYYARMGDGEIYGRERALQAELEELTALGMGDHLFSAMYPLCKTVFGFYDALEDACPGNYAYLACGFYSKEKCDPLSCKSPEKIIRDFFWNWEAGSISPDSTVFHGAVYDVLWQGREINYIKKDREDMEVALAPSSAEALSAYMQQSFPEIPGMERMLNALQSGILEEFGNTEQEDSLITLENKLHERTFDVSKGGFRHVLRPAKTDKKTFCVPGNLYARAKRISQKNKDLNKLREKNADYSREIYFLWHRYVMEKTSPFTSDDVSRTKEMLEEALEAYETGKQREASECKELKEALGGVSKKLKKKGIKLSAVPENSYYNESQPALLLINKNQKRTCKQGFQKNQAGVLPCRMQAVTSMEVELFENKRVFIGYEELKEACEELCAPLPPVIEKLCMETILTGGMFAEALAGICMEKAGLREDEKCLREAAKKLRQQQETMAGRPFSIAAKQWRQPWNPVVLGWEVKMTPARTNMTEDNSFEFFELGDIDWEAGCTDFGGKEVSLNGQVLLTPHAPFVFGKMAERILDCYDKDSTEWKEIKEMLEELSSRQILSQQLSGFNEAFQGLHRVPFLPVMSYSEDREEMELARRTAKAVNDVYPVSVINGDLKNYVPFRCGLMKLESLHLIDEFGQYREINIPQNIIIGESLRCGKANTALLRPRFPGAVRLNFDWVCKTDMDAKEVSYIGNSPVYGFLKPNIFDFNVQFYNADGKFMGWVQRSDTGLQWKPCPGRNMHREEICDEQLLKMIDAMLLWETEDFIRFIEKTDQFFSEKTSSDGQPAILSNCLAMVRAEVSVEEQGRRKKYWGNLENTGSSYEKSMFSMKVGDERLMKDGVVIYFEGRDGEENYSRFYTGGESLRGFTLEKSKRKLTMLIDPYRQVTIRTGFLPVYQTELEPEQYVKQMGKIKLMLNMWPVLTPDKTALPVTEIFSNRLKGLSVEKGNEITSFKIEKAFQNIPAVEQMKIEEFYLEIGDREDEK